MDVKNLLDFPKKLITLWKDRDLIQKECQPLPDPDWFKSDAGKAALDNAKTPVQQTLFFYEYLCAVRIASYGSSNFNSAKETLYKYAYIMANVIYGTSLELGSYPTILDEAKNIIVRYISRVDFTDAFNVVRGLVVIEEISNLKNSLITEKRPYTGLTYCDETGDISDQYKIERYILGAFCTDYNDTFMFPPYLYSILTSNLKSDTNSNDDEK